MQLSDEVYFLGFKNGFKIYKDRSLEDQSKIDGFSYNSPPKHFRGYAFREKKSRKR